MRKPRRRTARLFMPSLFILLSGVGTCAAQELSLANRDISIKIIGPNGAELKTPSPQNVEVIGQKVTFKQGDTIKNLLLDNRVIPDADALGLIYDLNTCYGKLNEITPGSVLFLPRVRVREPRSPLPPGVLAILNVEARRKEQLLAAIPRFDEMMIDLRVAVTAVYGKGAEAAAITRSIVDIWESFNVVRTVVREKLFPLSGDTLDQLTAQAELTRSVLGNSIQKRLPLSPSDRESIELVKEELLLKRKRFTETRGHGDAPAPLAARIVVKTVRVEGSKRVDENNLRVYFISVAFCDREGNVRNREQLKSFDGLTSPAEQILSEANYWVWAGRGDDPTPVTDRKKQFVRIGPKGEPLPPVELLVVR